MAEINGCEGLQQATWGRTANVVALHVGRSGHEQCLPSMWGLEIGRAHIFLVKICEDHRSYLGPISTFLFYELQFLSTPSKSPGCNFESLDSTCQHLQANSLLQHTASWLGAESLPQQRNMCLKVSGLAIWNSWNHDSGIWMFHSDMLIEYERERSNHRHVECVSNFADCGECFSL